MKLDILDLDLLYPLHFHEIKVFSSKFLIFSGGKFEILSEYPAVCVSGSALVKESHS